MTLRIALLPHAGFPHVLPFFRLARELLRGGHDVRLLGSDVAIFARGHSEAWRQPISRFGYQDRATVHDNPSVPFFDWLIEALTLGGFDVLIVDAIWQGLAFGFQGSKWRGKLVIHHAGLPDFRSQDMPTLVFMHPGHSEAAHAEQRTKLENFERNGRGVRQFLAHAKMLSPGGRRTDGRFELGCGEYANVPAVRTMSLCPAIEFPRERGRVAYLGSMLPRPGDRDWQMPPHELSSGDGLLVALVFGTTGLQGSAEYQWLSRLGGHVARRLPSARVVAVMLDQSHAGSADDLPGNLLALRWVPLWELLSTRTGPTVLITTPGIGALREAAASGTPVLAIPRRFDQFGAAARVEFFDLGAAIVSPNLPDPDVVVERLISMLDRSDIRTNCERMKAEFAAFDAGAPLTRFLDQELAAI